MKDYADALPGYKSGTDAIDSRINNENLNKLTRDQVEKIFTYGMNYMLARKQPELDFGQFPTDNYYKAIDYVYRLIIENERDEECLRCKRLESGSCIGTIDRGRESIDDHNRCAAFIDREK